MKHGAWMTKRRTMLLSVFCLLAMMATGHTRTLTPLADIVQIAADWVASCAVTAQGGVKCWGTGYPDQEAQTAIDVKEFTRNVVALDQGDLYPICAISRGGRVKCLYKNNQGQIKSINIKGINARAVAIKVGYGHACVLTITGGVRCWGLNGYGQLGDGTRESRQTAVAVNGLDSGVTAISMSGSQLCLDRNRRCQMLGGDL